MATARQDGDRRPGQRAATLRARAGSALARAARAWGDMAADQRLAVVAAVALFFTMLLPWYTKTNTLVINNAVHSTQSSFSAFGAFSFVEAAVLLVSAGVLIIVFARAEERAFHLPGGDGLIIMLAGTWAAILIFYRMLAKPGLRQTELLSATQGITWGIFVSLLVAAAVAIAGWRIRMAHHPEPSLLGNDGSPFTAPAPVPPRPPPSGRTERAASTRRSEPASRPAQAERGRLPPPPRSGDQGSPARGTGRMITREDAEQLSFDDPPLSEPFDEGRPAVRRRDDPPRRRRRRA